MAACHPRCSFGGLQPQSKYNKTQNLQSMSETRERLPVTVLTGFLGSGKRPS